MAKTAKLEPKPAEIWLLAATFLVAISGLIYELIAATASSYLLGDTVKQFSFVIGLFLSAMGLGAWLSRYVQRALPGFVWGQIALGVFGGFLAPAVFFIYAAGGSVEFVLYGTLIAIGVLSGMEIPLLARVLKQTGAGQFRFENILSFDYLGALVASLMFPVLILPYLGLMTASLAFGCLNLAVAGISIWIFRARLPRRIMAVWALAFVGSCTALLGSERLVSLAHAGLFEDDVIYRSTSAYQNITVTRYRDRTRLYLDHSIQFDSLDEHRYHEALVHPAMARVARRQSVLVLGGGDGMAVREVLRYPDVVSIKLVDLDPAVTDLFKHHRELAKLNHQSLQNDKVEVINQDAWQFVDQDQGVYDVIILDLPDPKSISLSKLYSREFYSLLTKRLSPYGIVVTQAGSPVFARKAFWSIANTWTSVRFRPGPTGTMAITPYHAYVPSFGDWGFVMASARAYRQNKLELPSGLQYLTSAVFGAAQVFPKDADQIPAKVNDLKSHALVSYYNQGWNHWFR